jgi:hypothetical protein
MTHSEAIQSAATERYLLDEMSEAERQAFEAHYFECAECADEVRVAARMRDGVAAGLAASAAARPRASHMRSPVIAWAAAAALVVVAGYQALLLQRRPEPIGAQALAPVTVRAASRGADVVVPYAGPDRPITLALPIDVLPATPLTYDVRSDSGVIASGSAVAPNAGAPLLLLLPGWTVRPQTHYSLAVHRADGTLVDEFRFVAAR